MGRILKRVPLSFDYPIDEVWYGYLNPYYNFRNQCNGCGGTGYNEETYELYKNAMPNRIHRIGWIYSLTEVEVNALLKYNKLWYFTRVPLNNEHKKLLLDTGEYWLPFDNGYIPSPEEVNNYFITKEPLGHDDTNRRICTVARAIHQGVFGHCDICDGTGSIWVPSIMKKMAYEWIPFDPPLGEGYQLWETTTEGSPQSPVFDNITDLAIWCESHATIFAGRKMSINEWINMFNIQNNKPIDPIQFVERID